MIGKRGLIIIDHSLEVVLLAVISKQSLDPSGLYRWQSLRSLRLTSRILLLELVRVAMILADRKKVGRSQSPKPLVTAPHGRPQPQTMVAPS